MKLSREWLNEFTPVSAPDRDFAEAMTLSGSKVEITEVEGAEIENVVVGKVLSLIRHPNSDHMWICPWPRTAPPSPAESTSPQERSAERPLWACSAPTRSWA